VSREFARLSAITTLAVRGSLGGLRALGLAAFAAIPSLIALAVVSAHPAPHALSDSVEGLVSSLTLPIVVMVIVLVIAVGQFRNEIDAETLVYLSDRSVARSTIVAGKYLGAVAVSLLFVVPAALVPLAIAVWGGGTPYPSTAPVAVAAATALAVAVYVGFFLLLGLVSRYALLIGLLYGFVWEELVPFLPGDAPRLTVVFYLRSFLARALSSGPLSGYSHAVSEAAAVATLLVVTLVLVGAAAVLFRTIETAPERESA
jgi:ABC-2 type transport system permease protein